MTYEQTLMEMEEKGKIIGRAEAIKKLMENANLSAEKAMEMLGIEKEEFPKYLKLL